MSNRLEDVPCSNALVGHSLLYFYSDTLLGVWTMEQKQQDEDCVVDYGREFCGVVGEIVYPH